MDTIIVNVQVPEGHNAVLGQSHFIKSVEDLFEALVNAVPNIKFGLAFCESSGPCLVRVEGNDEGLQQLASKTALELFHGNRLRSLLHVVGNQRISRKYLRFCRTSNEASHV